VPIDTVDKPESFSHVGRHNFPTEKEIFEDKQHVVSFQLAKLIRYPIGPDISMAGKERRHQWVGVFLLICP